MPTKKTPASPATFDAMAAAAGAKTGRSRADAPKRAPRAAKKPEAPAATGPGYPSPLLRIPENANSYSITRAHDARVANLKAAHANRVRLAQNEAAGKVGKLATEDSAARAEAKRLHREGIDRVERELKSAVFMSEDALNTAIGDLAAEWSKYHTVAKTREEADRKRRADEAAATATLIKAVDTAIDTAKTNGTLAIDEVKKLVKEKGARVVEVSKDGKQTDVTAEVAAS